MTETRIHAPGLPGSVRPSRIDADSFAMEESKDIVGLAKTLLGGRHAGILSTVNEEGKPEVRWMAALAFDEFPIFYTLTPPDSRKVDQIINCPDVHWMFFNSDMSLILNLAGTARVLADKPALKHAWKLAKDASHTYFLNRFDRGLGFVVIETKVESISCTSPNHALELATDEASPGAPAPLSTLDSAPER